MGSDAGKACPVVKKLGLKMHFVSSNNIFLKTPSFFQAGMLLDDLLFRGHLEIIEVRRNLWHKACDQMKKPLS
jgi:hypothetical protein